MFCMDILYIVSIRRLEPRVCSGLSLRSALNLLSTQGKHIAHLDGRAEVVMFRALIRCLVVGWHAESRLLVGRQRTIDL